MFRGSYQSVSGKRLAQQSEDLALLSDWDMWLLLRTHVLFSPGKLTSLYHEATLTTLKPLSHEYLTGYRDNRVTLRIAQRKVYKDIGIKSHAT